MGNHIVVFSFLFLFFSSFCCFSLFCSCIGLHQHHVCLLFFFALLHSAAHISFCTHQTKPSTRKVTANTHSPTPTQKKPSFALCDLRQASQLHLFTSSHSIHFIMRFLSLYLFFFFMPVSYYNSFLFLLSLSIPSHCHYFRSIATGSHIGAIGSTCWATFLFGSSAFLPGSLSFL